ncbi:MAG: hypothetical protein Q4B28_03000 [bacterium]|nr:hypothetical protein [bacterium]
MDVNLSALEKQLGVLGLIEAHKTEKDLLVINAKLADSANILLSPAIKGNIKLENGNLLIHKDTPVRALAAHLADRKVATLDIGAQTSTPDAKILNASTLENLKAEGWFTEDVIDVTKLPIAKAKLSVEKFNAAREELKKQLEKSDFKPSFDLNALNLIQDAGKFQIEYKGEKTELPAGHHLLIDAKGQIKFEKIKNAENFKIILEGYKSQKFIHSEVLKIDQDVQMVIDKVYTDLSLLTSNGINNVAHKRAGSELAKLYTTWRDQLKEACCYKIGEKIDPLYAAAGTMDQLLIKIQEYLLATDGGKVTGMFADTLHYLRSLQDSSLPSDKVKLQQLLLALDGMFSRTQNVRGTNQEDHYQLVYGNESNETTLRSIITTNKLRIIQKIKKEKPDCAEAYENLFKAMEQGLDTLGNPNAQVEAIRKDGVIAYNFGNPDDLMRPIINPHILKGSEKSEAEQPIDPQIKLHTLQNLFDEDSVLVADLME